MKLLPSLVTAKEVFIPRRQLLSIYAIHAAYSADAQCATLDRLLLKNLRTQRLFEFPDVSGRSCW